MKRIYPFAICFVAILFGLYWFQTRHGRLSVRRETVHTKEHSNEIRKPTNFASTNTIYTTNLPASVQAELAVKGKDQRESRQLLAATSWLNQQNGRIDFWGLVVDQDARPLAGVEVEMRVRQWTLAANLGANAHFPKFHRVTDAAGRFHLQEANGDVMSIDSVRMPGYSLSREDRRSISFAYHDTPNPFVPSAASPVIIRLWKSRGSVPLIHHDGLSAKVAVTGSPLQIDLITGRMTETGGQLEVRLFRNPETIIDGQRRGYSWKATLSVRGGGVQWRDDYFGYEAPDDGYLPNLELGQAADDPDWKNHFSGELYFRTEQGQYGRLKFTLNTFSQPPPCGFYYSIDLNPTGSRNLEYDDQQRIDPRKLIASSSNQMTPQAPPPPPKFVPPVQPRPIAPVIPQPPPGFQAFTNRGKAFPPPVQPRQP